MKDYRHDDCFIGTVNQDLEGMDPIFSFFFFFFSNLCTKLKWYL
jgi:hypothetical protein